MKAGDLLAEIDPRPYQVQLAQAEGQLARDQALLAERAHRPRALPRRCCQQDSIAKQQLDTQEALVRQYEGTVKLDQAQVDNAKLQLTYAASPRRSAGASACARSTPATSCTRATPTAWW